MKNHVKLEIIVGGGVLLSVTACVLVKVISADDYTKIICVLMGYVLGRLNGKEAKQAIADFFGGEDE